MSDRAVRAVPVGERFAVVDEEDFPKVEHLTWSEAWRSKDLVYAVARVPGSERLVYMHRLVLGVREKVLVDHWNGNGLDNRRSNLRSCDSVQNQGNRRPSVHSSRFKGVYWDRTKKKWSAQIVWGGRAILIGRFDREEYAARAYDGAALAVFGEFARLNNVLEA